jgi:hypothetical protein
VTALHYLGDFAMAIGAGIITDLVKRLLDKRDDPDDTSDTPTPDDDQGEAE